jgi:hypothetical protein
MPAHLTPLPAPSGKHATCAWCRRRFATVVQLIDHVDDLHVSDLDAHHRHDDRAA